MHLIQLASGREWRGGQRQAFLLSRGLHRAGVPTTVITGEHTELESRLREADVPVVGVPWRAGLDPRVAVALNRRIVAGTIIHAHDAHAHWLADTLGRLRSARVVATRRVDLPVRHARRWHRASGVIALSHAIAERLSEVGVASDRIHVIPPAVDRCELAEPWPSTLPVPGHDTPIVACIAALTPEKGVDTLLAAMPELLTRHPRARLIVLGDGPLRGPLEALARTLHVDGSVTFAGHVRHPGAVLSHAVVAVQPSRSEGFGSAVLDAQIRGVPVVASATGGLPDALAGGGGILVPPGDPVALATALRSILDDPALRARLSRLALLAADQFSVERLVSGTLDVYRSA